MGNKKSFAEASEDFKNWYTVENRGYKTPCWIWKAPDYSRGGYGRVWFSGKGVSSHIFSWMIHRGAIPEGLEVCHHCDIGPCVNPEHLFLGTHLENIRDAYSKNRIEVLKGTRQGGAKLDDEKVRFIRKNYKRGINTYKYFAKMFGVDQALIHRIIIRENWAHVI